MGSVLWGGRFAGDVETDVYRIAQESVDQHVKHVQARQVRISLAAPAQGTPVMLQVPQA